MTMVETEPVSPIQMASEQSKDQPDPETESSSIPPALSSFSASDLVVATGSGSSTLIIGPISALEFGFLETVPLKTHFLKISPPVLTLANLTIPES